MVLVGTERIRENLQRKLGCLVVKSDCRKCGLLSLILFITLTGSVSSVSAMRFNWTLKNKNTEIFSGIMETGSNDGDGNTESISACSPSLPCLSWTSPACVDHQHSNFATGTLNSILSITYTANQHNQPLAQWNQLFPVHRQPIEHRTTRQYTYSAAVRPISSILLEAVLKCFCCCCLYCNEGDISDYMFEDTRGKLSDDKWAARNKKTELECINPIPIPEGVSLIGASVQHCIYRQGYQASPHSLQTSQNLTSSSEVITMNLLLQDVISLQWLHQQDELNLSALLVIPELFRNPVNASLHLSPTQGNSNRHDDITSTHYLRISAGVYELVYYLLRSHGVFKVLRLEITGEDRNILTINREGISSAVHFPTPPTSLRCTCNGACQGNCNNNNGTDHDEDEDEGAGSSSSRHGMSIEDYSSRF